MRKIAVATGDSFGRLTLIEELPSNGNRRQGMWQCACGRKKRIGLLSVVRGCSKSCGCWHAEIVSAIKKKHGESVGKKLTPEFSIWKGMLARCSKSQIGKSQYATNGIKVCERWLKYENFLEDMGRKPSASHSIDRHPDRNGNYEHGNCRWATKAEQCMNRSNSYFMTFYGVTKHLCEWAEISAVPARVIRSRLRSGWSEKMAVWKYPQKRTDK